MPSRDQVERPEIQGYKLIYHGTSKNNGVAIVQGITHLHMKGPEKLWWPYVCHKSSDFRCFLPMPPQAALDENIYFLSFSP